MGLARIATAADGRRIDGWIARLGTEPVKLGGLCLLSFGGAAAALAAALPIGTLARLGPGFLPFAVALAVMGCALVILLTRSGAASTPCAGGSRGAGLTLLGLALFAVLVEPAGALVAAVALGAVAAMAAGLPVLRALAAGGAIGIGGVLVFAFGLGVPLRLVPAF